MPKYNKLTTQKKSAYKKWGRRKLATTTKWMSSESKWSRALAVDTKLFYFKRAGMVTTDLNGDYQGNFNARQLTQLPLLWPQFTLLTGIYSAYKVLGIKIKWHAANVGIEAHDSFLPGSDLTLLRGNCCTWTDQREDNTPVIPIPTIIQIINEASAKIHQPRSSFSRTLFRGKGFNEWGFTQPTAMADSWNGGINMVIRNATPAGVTTLGTEPVLFYYTISFKVVFQGRRSL